MVFLWCHPPQLIHIFVTRSGWFLYRSQFSTILLAISCVTMSGGSKRCFEGLVSSENASSSNSTPADATEEEEQKIISSSSSSKKRRFSQDDDEDEGKDLCVFTPGPLESDFRCSYSNQQKLKYVSQGLFLNILVQLYLHFFFISFLLALC